MATGLLDTAVLTVELLLDPAIYHRSTNIMLSYTNSHFIDNSFSHENGNDKLYCIVINIPTKYIKIRPTENE